MARWPNGYCVRLSRQRSQVRNLEATFFIFYFSSPYVGRREKSIRRRFFAPLRVAKAVKKGPLVFTPFSIPLAASWSAIKIHTIPYKTQVFRFTAPINVEYREAQRLEPIYLNINSQMCVCL